MKEARYMAGVMIAYGYSKAPWYMKGRPKPNTEQMPLAFACRPPRGNKKSA
jgi:hypothetical protein